jgi:hypothetical protein
MSLPELTTAAEGDLPRGQHWILRAGGTREDFTFLEPGYVAPFGADISGIPGEKLAAVVMIKESPGPLEHGAGCESNVCSG